MFQFLLGTLITEACLGTQKVQGVSIPLRYADNCHGDHLILIIPEKFHLLGTLITLPGSYLLLPTVVSIPLRYADNVILGVWQTSSVRFHLLGTLITLVGTVTDPPMVVSIPLRYADNHLLFWQHWPGCFVSIPLRYADNGAAGTRITRSFSSFNSS